MSLSSSSSYDVKYSSASFGSQTISSVSLSSPIMVDFPILSALAFNLTKSHDSELNRDSFDTWVIRTIQVAIQDRKQFFIQFISISLDLVLNRDLNHMIHANLTTLYHPISIRIMVLISFYILKVLYREQ